VRLEDDFLVTEAGCERLGELGLGLELADGQ
jgi:Xaa-Pro aminopeptidase